MRLLFITHHLIDSNNGGSFASRAYANAFADVSSECMIMYPDRGKPVRQYINNKYILMGIDYRKSNFKKFVDIYLGNINHYESMGKKAIDAFRPDIVVFDNSRCSKGVITYAKQLGIKIITIHHNFELEYHTGTPPNILWRIPFLYYIKSAEREAVLYSDLNITLTKQDALSLKSFYGKEQYVNIKSLGCFESISQDNEFPVTFSNYKRNEFKFVITGSLNTFQTEFPLVYFIENIYSKILKLYPYSELLIAGYEPSKKIKDLCEHFPSINLVINPIDIQLVIDNSSIYICPISVGGGLKLRIMDGLKAGIPVIAHYISARGYDEFVDKGCMYTYSNDDSFFKQLNALIKKKSVLSYDCITSLYAKNFSYQSGLEKIKNELSNI